MRQSPSSKFIQATYTALFYSFLGIDPSSEKSAEFAAWLPAAWTRGLLEVAKRADGS